MAQPQLVGQSVTRLVIQDEVIMRVPVQPRPLSPQFEWHEKKGPSASPPRKFAALFSPGREQVDFVLGGPKRIRAELDEDCPALDFYGGIYLQPQDQKLCAGRDAIHSRMGGSCTIERFRQLIPKLRH